MTKEEKLLETFLANKNALMNNDLDTLKRIYADEYRGYNMRGEMEKKELIFEFYAPGMVHLNAFETEDLTSEVLGDVGIITGRGYIQGQFQEHQFEHHLQFTDLFVWRNNQWYYYLSQSTELGS